MVFNSTRAKFVKNLLVTLEVLLFKVWNLWDIKVFLKGLSVVDNPLSNNLHEPKFLVLRRFDFK